MSYLILNMLISGLIARVTLLSVRGGIFHSNAQNKPIVRVLVEFLGSVGSLLSFVIAFFLFEWWLPIVSLAIGYMLVAPLLVRPNTFGVFYKLQPVLTLFSIGCSLMILEMYFKFL